MTIQEAIKRINKSEPEIPDLDQLARSMGIHEYLKYDDDYLSKCRMKQYWLASHICTDTQVGFALLFLDDICVGYTQQIAREADKEYNWFTRSDYNKVRTYILSLVEEEYYNPNHALDSNLKDIEYFKDGYYHSYEEESLNLIPNPVLISANEHSLTLIDVHDNLYFYQEEQDYLNSKNLDVSIGLQGPRKYVLYLEHKNQVPLIVKVIQEALEHPILFKGDVTIKYKVIGPTQLF